MNGQFDLGAITPARYFYGIAAVLGLLFTFISPGSEALVDFPRQLLLWQLQTVGPMALIVSAHIGLSRLAVTKRWSPYLRLGLSGAIGAFLFSPFALVFDITLGDDPAPGNLVLEWLDELGAIGPPIIICWVAINLPWLWGFRIERKATPQNLPQTPEPQPRPISGPKFLDLLPEDIQGDLLYLKAELHYISVVTTKGKALILYNLKTAIEELNTTLIEGMQCHRSYWVALDSIQKWDKRGRQGTLLMVDGEKVPVSRAHVEKVNDMMAGASVNLAS